MRPRSVTGHLANMLHRDASLGNGSSTLAFDDNRLLSSLFGEHDEHLALIESRLGVDITPRGNRIAVRGSEEARDKAGQVLERLYGLARQGHDIGPGDVDGAIRMTRLAEEAEHAEGSAIRTKRKVVTPRTPMQRAYMDALRRARSGHRLRPGGNRQDLSGGRRRRCGAGYRRNRSHHPVASGR